jgi:glycosidase
LREFIFGTLGNPERRVEALRGRRQGVWHLSRIEPLAPGPNDEPLLTVEVALPEPVARVVCHVRSPGRLSVELEPAAVEWDTLNWTYYQVWQGRLPAAEAGTVVRYTVNAYPRHAAEPVPADGGATFAYRVGRPEPPDWAAEAIIYQIMPDRFFPGAGRSWRRPKDAEGLFGGTLQGIAEKLDYLGDLGINCIWLNPFFPDETHHGYHATDYFQVNPRLGGDAAMRQLVQEAHRRGIRLLLDFVANHWGRNHPTFQAAQAERHSDYHEWYTWRSWPDDYEAFFDVKALPQINLGHPAARAHILEAARYWLTEFDFDGYRLDYVLGPSLEFWTDFRAEVERARPDAWIFGEAVDTPAAQRRYWGRLHGTLDFLLLQALRATFAFGDMTVAGFDAFLAAHEAYFPAAFSRPSFLDNHDMNRFLWAAEGDGRKLKLAALAQFTLSGPPVVYYGTEVGLSQERDIVQASGRHIHAEARLPMLWGDAQDGDLREYYRWLIHFRRDHPVLWQGMRRTAHLDEAAGTYAYVRGEGPAAVVVALNLSEEARVIDAAGHAFSLAPWSGDVRVGTP